MLEDDSIAQSIHHEFLEIWNFGYLDGLLRIHFSFDFTLVTGFQGLNQSELRVKKEPPEGILEHSVPTIHHIFQDLAVPLTRIMSIGVSQTLIDLIH